MLEQLRSDWSADDPSEANLWPEHFDLAIEAGSEKDGSRANYGFSPGDAEHEEPYLYVGPWSGKASGELWQAKGFTRAPSSISRSSPLVWISSPWRSTSATPVRKPSTKWSRSERKRIQGHG